MTRRQKAIAFFVTLCVLLVAATETVTAEDIAAFKTALTEVMA